MNYLMLSELAYLIKSTIQSSINDEYWVIAEIAQINCHYSSGHCYLDLVEKQDDVTTAKMRATIWASLFGQIGSNFRALTGQDLQTGMNILMLARVTYHEVHGLSLNIRDIDPRYTLGEMALKRKRIIEQLSKEGIIDKNRQLSLPPVIQNIAVISSVTAAGYGDFLSRLDNNDYGYRFCHRLFQAYMQGEKAEGSMLSALKKCIRLKEHFDAVVIIRGGGSTVDLHSFDSYPLAKMIALSPLPVFTGIGHERDETVADRVSNIRLITPTAAAEFLISRAKQFEDRVDDLRQRLIIRTNTLVEREKHQLDNIAGSLKSRSRYYLKTAITALRNNIYLFHTRALSTLRTPSLNLKAFEGRLKNASEGLIKNNHQKLGELRKVLSVYPGHMLSLQLKILESYEIKINLLAPREVMKRGYSITYLNGKVLKDPDSVRKDDIISTRLYSGSIVSIVESTGEDQESE
jgi:exodeoxyribonuclease VII large subunit